MGGGGQERRLADASGKVGLRLSRKNIAPGFFCWTCVVLGRGVVLAVVAASESVGFYMKAVLIYHSPALEFTTQHHLYL